MSRRIEASKTLTAVELVIAVGPAQSYVDIISIDHDETLGDRHIIAVIGGRMHQKGSCNWCNELIVRCLSRRIA